LGNSFIKSHNLPTLEILSWRPEVS